ncbi:MAG: hypothetical protein WBR10_05710 [Candidatus Acidiferrum sp.]
MTNHLTTGQTPGLKGTPDDLATLLVEGLASKQLTEGEFWDSVNKQTRELLFDGRASLRS